MIETALALITRINIVLSSVALLIAFSLLAYLFFYNFRSRVARSFVAMLSFLCLVFVGDVFLSTARLPAGDPGSSFWLGFQWLGIAFVAPAFLAFSDAMLATTGERSLARKLAILAGYLIGLVALFLISEGNLLVGDTIGRPGSLRFEAGPVFPIFTIIYAGLSTWAGYSLFRARGRSLTARSMRRNSSLLVSIIAPIASFPWLIAGGSLLDLGSSPSSTQLVFRSVIAFGNAATAVMLMIVAYGVAYQGALTPERAIKREFIKYLIQVPFLGGFVLTLIQLVPERLEESLSLPRDIILMLATVLGIVSYQLLVRALKPVVDWLIYGDLGRDAIWLRKLDERLITQDDLEQLLENILAAMCDRLRVKTGCVVAFSEGRPRIDVFTGDRERTNALLGALSAEKLSALRNDETFTVLEGFWVHALRTPDGVRTLGLLAIEHPGRPLEPSEDEEFRRLIGAAERALEDRIVQSKVVDALRALEPEMEDVQRLRGRLEQQGQSAIAVREEGVPVSPDIAKSPEFSAMVKDALSHYWGGPKLTQSPLMNLRVVRQALDNADNNPAKAMREVLNEALEGLRPDGERSLSANQWTLYNILELKFVKGLKVRDIALRLSLSESDLYRKQRVAIDALAEQLASMEGDPDQ